MLTAFVSDGEVVHGWIGRTDDGPQTFMPRTDKNINSQHMAGAEDGY
jgi:hypothetical protein